MRRIHKFLSIILAIMMVISTIPITASAATYSGTCGDNVTWKFDDSTGTLTISGTGAMADNNRPWGTYKNNINTVVIEDGVTSIGKSAFYEYPSITSVIIPDSVISIGISAFYKCASLKEVTIPDSVTSIGQTAFYYCTALKTVKLSANLKIIESNLFAKCSNLESVVIPYGITTIGASAFQNCKSLNNIDIPETVTTIGAVAFAGCTSLTEIVIPEGVTMIDDDTFSGCSSLETITLPESLTTIERQAFTKCTSLKDVYYSGTEYKWENEVTIGSNNDPLKAATKHFKEEEIIKNTCGETAEWYYNTKTHTLIISGTGAMYDYEYNNRPWEMYEDEIEAVVVIDGITVIGKYAFYGLEKITGITIPSSVTTIKDNAFGYCQGITNITIPDTVTTLGAAFGSCYNLKTITIGDGVTTIAGSTFFDCRSLESVVIGDNITSIGRMSFNRCSGLKNVIIGNGVTTIEEYAFDSCTSLEKLILGNSLETIGKDAFYRCESLTSVVFPESLKTIGEYAFDYCISLESVAIPNGVTTIGLCAFYSCFNLKNVTISESVTTIGNNAFNNCASLETITVDSNNPNYSSDEYGVLFNKDKTTLIQYPAGNARASYVIPDSVIVIGNDAFFSCGNLTSVTIPEGVTTIGNSAFSHCYNITNVIIPESVTIIGDSAFARCDNLTSVIIPEGVTTIGHSAFYLCNSLSTVIIPDSVTTIGGYAFGYCENLTDVTFGTGITLLDEYVFIGCTSLTDIILPDGLTSVPGGTFANCTNLKYITIPKSVTEIGYKSFDGCSTLKTVFYLGLEEDWSNIIIYEKNDPLLNATKHFKEEDTIKNACGDNVTWTYNEATYTLTILGTGDMYDYEYDNRPWESYEDKIKNVVINDGVTMIGDFAFYSCSKIENITIPKSISVIGKYAFHGCENLTNITIPDSVTIIDEWTFAYCESLTNITIPKSISVIGKYAFHGCENLTNITIPDSVTIIDEWTFAYCESLINITIPEGVTTIGDYAFAYCDNLTYVTIPDSVTTLGEYTFYSCDIELLMYYSGTEAQWNTLLANNNISDLSNFIVHCTDKIIYPSGVCGDNLTWTFDLTTGTLTISGTGDMYNYEYDDKFLNSNSPWGVFTDYIQNVVINDGVTSIGDCAFAYNDNLINIVIPDSITSIGNYAFYLCSGIPSIKIPKSVTVIGENAFYRCDNLISITVDDANQYYSSDEYGVLFNKDKETLIQYPIGNNRADYIIPDSVTTIGNYAFYDCIRLTSITIPDSVTTISKYAFYHCENLIDISIGANVTSIGMYAFNYSAFYDDSSNWSDGVLYIDDYLITVADLWFRTDYQIRDWTKVIADMAFSPSTSTQFLKNITIPKSVIAIGEDAFDYCWNIENVYYSGTEEEWNQISVRTGNEDLLNTTIHFEVPLYSEECGDNLAWSFDRLTGTLTISGTGAMYDYDDNNPPWENFKEQIKNVIISDGATTVGNYAFDSCIALENVIISDSITTIGNYAFRSCNKITGITFPDNLETIGDDAFYDCDNLTYVTIPDSVTEIGDYAFCGCTGLANVELPDSVTTIGKYAFYACQNLITVIIGSGVQTIDRNAFYNCNSLTDVYYTGAEAQWNKISIGEKNVPLLNATIHYNYTPPFTGVKDDHFYKEDVMQKAYQLVEFDGDFYYIGDRHQIVKNKKVYIKTDRLNGLTYADGTPLQAGWYNFDENGKMVILSGVVGNNIYKNNTKLKAYQLVEVDGDFYYIGDRHEIVKNKRIYLTEERINGLTYADGTPIKAGTYTFDENGKMIILNGVVGNYFYKNNEKLKAYQLVEVDGDFYYIGDRHEIVKDKKVYIKAERTNGLTYADGTPLQAGWYSFDENGKLVVE